MFHKTKYKTIGKQKKCQKSLVFFSFFFFFSFSCTLAFDSDINFSKA